MNYCITFRNFVIQGKLETPSLHTDDPQWGHTQIHKPYFTGEIIPLLCSHDHHLYPGFYNQTQQDSAGLDMAVLSSCHHMVLSRGTFGLWGNILSGSSRVLPKHFLAETVRKPLELSFACRGCRGMEHIKQP